MRRPKTTEQLTKAGTERKRAPGGGRKPMGRTAQPPKIRPESLGTFRGIAQLRSITVAEAVELSAKLALDVLMGIDPRRWIENEEEVTKP